MLKAFRRCSIVCLALQDLGHFRKFIYFIFKNDFNHLLIYLPNHKCIYEFYILITYFLYSP